MNTPVPEPVVPITDKTAGFLGPQNGQAVCLGEAVDQEELPFVSVPLQPAGTVPVTYRYVGRLKPRPHTLP